jgi:hypothetical protein
LQDKFVVISARDSMVFNYPRWDKTNNNNVRVDAFAGNQDLSPIDFLQTAECFTPDLLVPLSDEMPIEATDPRVRLGVTRSLRSPPPTPPPPPPSGFPPWFEVLFTPPPRRAIIPSSSLPP